MQIGQQPQMRVAQQQSHFGFFGGSNWNSPGKVRRLTWF